MFAASKTAAITTAANWIEECFSVYLYTGTGSSQTITNNIDTSTKGGLVWIKGRSGATGHRLTDTVRGATKSLESNSSAAEATESTGLTAFGTTGFTIGADADYNSNTATYASWTFREQAKFFDVVTWTGNGTGNRTIAHSLGSTPGFIQTKRTDTAESWWNHHRSVTSPNANWWRNYGVLDVTNAFADWGDNSGLYQSPDATNLYIGSFYNASGKTYVAYLFAHNAGGFGPAGSDNVISCGSVVGVSGDTTANIGYEPQWLLIKNRTSASDWWIVDTMRGLSVPSTNAKLLVANKLDAEAALGLYLTSTGFTSPNLTAGETYIYIAIRRGPMKTPTSGTSVFSPVARTGTGSAASITGVGFPPDLVMFGPRSIAENKYEIDRLRGAGEGLITNSTSGGIGLGSLLTLNMGGISMSDGNSAWNQNAATYVNWFFGRAPGFFDVVCYTGTGSATTQTHNLGAAPELLIVKSRDTAVNWVVWASAPTPQQNQYALNLNTAGTWGSSGDKIWGATLTGAPNMTSTTFSLGDYVGVNGSAKTYVAYLFASVTGVSKVGSYTGNGSNQTINCGFTAGARFVMIKRTDVGGDWYVWDTARGIVSGNDPRLSLNSTAAEVTTDDSIDPDNSGFIVNQLAATNINVSSATYIFLAIA